MLMTYFYRETTVTNNSIDEDSMQLIRIPNNVTNRTSSLLSFIPAPMVVIRSIQATLRLVEVRRLPTYIYEKQEKEKEKDYG
jgi:hypothetical protein